jgi:hypothetical protein
MFTSSGIDTLTIETTTEGVCEEVDECEGEDLSGSTTDGECEAPVVVDECEGEDLSGSTTDGECEAPVPLASVG